MDKQEYKLLSEEIWTLIADEQFQEAAEIADRIDWRKVRSFSTLMKISDLYQTNRRYEDALEVMLMAYDRNPKNRTIVYSLCELYILVQNHQKASQFLRIFERMAPRDSGAYILRFKLMEMEEAPLDDQIAHLEEFCRKDYREEWVYKLAYLYHRMGLGTKCVETCNALIAWFGEGPFVIKAMELKMLHARLTPEQQAVYDRREDIADQIEAYESDEYSVEKPEPGLNPAIDDMDFHVKTIDMGKFNTINLQKALAESMRELMGGEEKERNSQGRSARSATEDDFMSTGEMEERLARMGSRREESYPEEAYAEEGYSEEAYAEEGYSEEAYAEEGYSEEAYAEEGYSEEGYAEEGYAEGGYAEEGYSEEAYAEEGYSEEDYAEEGYSEEDYAGEGYSEEDYAGEGYSEEAYAEEGYSEEGYAEGGYAEEGYAEEGYTEEGYSEDSYAQVENMESGNPAEPQRESYEGPEAMAEDPDAIYAGMEPIEKVPGELASEPEGVEDQTIYFTPENLSRVPGSRTGGMNTGRMNEDEVFFEDRTDDIVIDNLPSNTNPEYESVHRRARQVQQEEELARSRDREAREAEGVEKRSRKPGKRDMDGMFYLGEDGQMGMAVPNRPPVEKQITGQIHINEYLSNWEKTKRRKMAQQEEELQRSITERTGPIFKDFDEGKRNGMLEEIQKRERIFAEKYQANDIELRSIEEVEEEEMEEAAKAEESLYTDGAAGTIDIMGNGPSGPTIWDEVEAAIEADRARNESAGLVDAAEKPDSVDAIVKTGETVGLVDAAEKAASVMTTGESAGAIRAISPEEVFGEDESAYTEVEEPEQTETAETDGGEEAPQEDRQEEEADAEEAPSREDYSDGEYAEGDYSDGEYAEGDYSDGEYAEGDYSDGEYAEGDYSDGEYAEGDYSDGEYAEGDYSDGEYAEGDYSDGEYAEGDYSDGEYAEGDYSDGEYAEGDYSDEEYAEGDYDGEEGYDDDGKYLTDADIGQVSEDSAGLNTAQLEEIAGVLEADADRVGQETVEEMSDEYEPEAENTLSVEEQKLFAEFLYSRKMRDQLLEAIDQISLAAYVGNAIITGDNEGDALELAKNLIKEIQMIDNNFVSNRIAKISGSKMNRRDIPNMCHQLAGGALIVEKASDIKKETLEILAKTLDNMAEGFFVILIDKKKGMERMLKSYEMIEGYFNAHIDIVPMNNNALVDFAKKYAYSKEYKIDEERGVLALHQRISELQIGEHNVTKSEVEDIVDEAIEHSRKAKVAAYFQILAGKRYDYEDMIILREKDFIR